MSPFFTPNCQLFTIDMALLTIILPKMLSHTRKNIDFPLFFCNFAIWMSSHSLGGGLRLSMLVQLIDN